METKKNEKNTPKFFCEICDFKCFTKSDWDRHITRPKHAKNSEWKHLETEKQKKTFFTCENCGKNYKNRDGLWKHKKKFEQFLINAK